jgi:cytochrome c oxidase assembly protein subunit 11
VTALAIDRRNRTVGLLALAFALAMLGLGYASVPLYRLFCQVTGFGGTTQRVEEAAAKGVAVTGRTISVRFDGNLERGMPWKFAPEQTTQSLRIGERKMAYFSAENLADHAITGIASFNVEPEIAGRYFTKIQCFCFNEQTLAAGQKVDMPVIYYVDPAILQDPEAKDIEQITLSYTFHPVAGQTTQESAAKPLDPAKAAR